MLQSGSGFFISVADVEVVSRAVIIFDNRFTNITIYEMSHFTLIRELLTIF